MVKNIKMFAESYCLHEYCICFPVSLHAAEQDALDALGGVGGAGRPCAVNVKNNMTAYIIE